LIRNFILLTSERKKKERLELRLKVLCEKIEDMQFEFTRKIIETVDGDGHLLYSNETKRTIARREMETSSKSFQALIIKRKILKRELSKVMVKYNEFINLRITLGNLVLLATIEPNLFKKRKRRRKKISSGEKEIFESSH
jgi:hypothetical protein